MTTKKEMVLIGGVAKFLRERGSWTGETHIQKTAFIAKTKREVPFESDFVLYKHGPFSFDMNKSIGHMLTRGVLTAYTNPGYGPSFRLNEALWRAIDKTVGGYFDQFETDLGIICDITAGKNVAELERIATAVYVIDSFPDVAPDEQAATICKLKPHISRDLAIQAISEARRIN
jgi:uncharacterized protein YwgA